jgi:hypoxanthine phosphoribosyltransferase
VTPLARVVHTRGQVDAALKRLGRELAAAFPSGALLVAVQKGGILVLADLVRRIDAPLAVDFVAVSDYEGGSGRAQIVLDLGTDIFDRDVVLVEDIVDTGLTCSYVLETFRQRSPRSLSVCALFDRRSRRIIPVPLRFVGFEATDELLIGRGLGVSGKYRNLDFVATVDPALLRVDSDAYASHFFAAPTDPCERPMRS